MCTCACACASMFVCDVFVSVLGHPFFFCCVEKQSLARGHCVCLFNSVFFFFSKQAFFFLSFFLSFFVCLFFFLMYVVNNVPAGL